MMPKIEASKNESKPVKMGLPITFEPLIYPHDFPKSLFFKPYRLIYRVHTKQVVVYVVADGRRDMESLLARRLLGA